MEQLNDVSGLRVGDYAYHRASGVLAKVSYLFAKGEFTDEQGKTVTAPVVGFCTGDHFLATVDGEPSCIALTPIEARFVVHVDTLLRGITEGIVNGAVKHAKMDAARATELWFALMRQHAKG